MRRGKSRPDAAGTTVGRTRRAPSHRSSSPSIRYERTASPAAASTMRGSARSNHARRASAPDAGRSAAHHQAVAVVLDFVNPLAARGGKEGPAG